MNAATNIEGLTLAEWHAAATFGAALGRTSDLPLWLARSEWRRGVDPTEWAAKLAEVPA